MNELVGRKEELEEIKEILASQKAEFLAVTGRRRVGKTFLVRQAFKGHLVFEITGIQDGDLSQQLRNFGRKIAEASQSPFLLEPPSDWFAAFHLLKAYLQTLSSGKKHVIFIDELPWMVTPKSNFLKALALFWNDYLSATDKVLVICGSATSWITKHIINNTGGLHNRITRTIQLYPFDLSETEQFLNTKNIQLIRYELTKVYMALGGIPFYLDLIKKGRSAAQIIEDLCFKDGAPLKNEFDNLYKALFSNAENHESIVKALGSKREGMERADIVKLSNVPDGGSFTRTLNELIASGFVKELPTFNKIKRGNIYRLIDNYSLFYLSFIQKNKNYNQGLWQQIAASQAYRIWCGYAFENVGLLHVDKIKAALGIASVYTQVSTLNIKKNENVKGFQIDLILNRNDKTINLIEMKFYDTKFSIGQSDVKKWNETKQAFKGYTGSKKQIFITFLTSNGVKENKYSRALIDAEIGLDQLF